MLLQYYSTYPVCTTVNTAGYTTQPPGLLAQNWLPLSQYRVILTYPKPIEHVGRKPGTARVHHGRGHACLGSQAEEERAEGGPCADHGERAHSRGHVLERVCSSQRGCGYAPADWRKLARFVVRNWGHAGGFRACSGPWANPTRRMLRGPTHMPAVHESQATVHVASKEPELRVWAIGAEESAQYQW